jgi:hypothetical protein
MTLLKIVSPAFEDGGEIPRHYTREGEDVSPPLLWGDVPEGSKSLALILEDPDAPYPAAPKTTFAHWVLYNIPASSDGLPENAAREGLPGNTRTGYNDWGEPEYGGPKPPIGRHRYVHRLFALDQMLELDHPNRQELLDAMEGRIVAEARLVGTYESQRPTVDTAAPRPGG